MFIVRRWQQIQSAVALFCFLAIAFGIAYTQDPIYNSPENQNTKYLQGLAAAGYGWLSEDWLANTLDPLPAFSAIVQFAYRYLHPEYSFYGFYFIIFGVYAWSMLGIVKYLYRLQAWTTEFWVYLAGFIAIHTVHLKIFEFDTGWDFHAGVAEQYLLGPVFQPANFGVLMILSILLFLYGKSYISVVLLAVAATIHPAYLIAAAVLTFSYTVVIFWKEKNYTKGLGVGASAFILVLPVFLYMSLTFAPTTPELWEQARSLIVNERIPHHSLPEVWVNSAVYVQTSLVCFACYLVRKSRLFWVLFIPTIAAVGLTLAQILFDSETLAFVAPWRLSVFLVPLASCIILAFIIRSYRQVIDKRQPLIRKMAIAATIILVLAGAIEQTTSFLYRDRATAAMEFVRTTKSSGETYLIPPFSKRFRKFRLLTGAPILINDKSHPYKDVEVIEWYNRLQLARQFYEQPESRCQILSTLVAQYQITHAVVEDDLNFNCPFWIEVFQDDNYGIYRVSVPFESLRDEE